MKRILQLGLITGLFSLGGHADINDEAAAHNHRAAPIGAIAQPPAVIDAAAKVAALQRHLDLRPAWADHRQLLTALSERLATLDLAPLEDFAQRLYYVLPDDEDPLNIPLCIQVCDHAKNWFMGSGRSTVRGSPADLLTRAGTVSDAWPRDDHTYLARLQAALLNNGTPAA